jgi:hypothetical protein
VRLKGQQLVLGNHEAVVQGLLDSLSDKAARLPHAVEFTVDPKKVARALSQVSLMDVMGSQQLAGLFAVSAEMGPLLSNSEQITGWLDSLPGGGHRFSLSWKLPASSGKP